MQCRHGRDRLLCPTCQRADAKPATMSKTFSAQPKGYLGANIILPDLRRRIPDNLFVCQQCHRRHRQGIAPDPTHRACIARLAQRDKEMPQSA